MERYTFKLTESITVSSDMDSREAKEGTNVAVTFVFNEWTAEELANRLIVSNSPRVSVQATLRKMKVIPRTYTYIVPKPGTRATMDWETKLIALVGEDKATRLIEKFGSAEDAIKAMAELLGDNE